MSQETLGQLLGVSFQQVQKYERGANRIGASTLFDMARVLDVGIPYFYEGIIDQSPARSVGFAEEAPNAPSPEGVSSSERIDLNSAFARIQDPRVRRRVLDFVKSVADEEAKETIRPE